MGAEYDYKPNSHRSKIDQKEQSNEKKVQKVVRGKVKTKKKKTRLKDVFISEDAANVKSYVFMDVLWPDFKETDLDYAIGEYNKRNRRFGGI